MADDKKTQNPEGKTPKEPPAEWLEAIGKIVEQIEPKDTEQALRDMEAFVEGDATWAEVQGIPRKMLFDIAEQAYLKFKANRLKEAKTLFKGLCWLDHSVAYFHTALGAIYQKEQNYFDALAEYTAAIELDPNDITAYVNRGEVYYLVGLDDQPIEDLDQAIALDPEGKDPWANRARFLKKKILQELAECEK